jgi:hypothetical protein
MKEDYNPTIMFFSATDSTRAYRQNIYFNLHILNFLNIDSTLGQVRL